MESATISCPSSTGLSDNLFPPEPNVHEGPEYENITTLYPCTGGGGVGGGGGV